ncbi:hypothetical protein PF002_g17294 [Phytophthora fragariae]|uniref:Uncharacterized protein n=1 Tax=Phytophthora fragariae TaxID=53985 RepID=A0A6A3YC55_9STRA|nr:hypothetical protein PF002_g17294 [Phytophthora fragariae]
MASLHISKGRWFCYFWKASTASTVTAEVEHGKAACASRVLVEAGVVLAAVLGQVEANEFGRREIYCATASTITAEVEHGKAACASRGRSAQRPS